jgi:hypothetical protein
VDTHGHAPPESGCLTGDANARQVVAVDPALRAFYDHVATNYIIIDSVGPQHWVIYARRSDLDKR